MDKKMAQVMFLCIYVFMYKCLYLFRGFLETESTYRTESVFFLRSGGPSESVARVLVPLVVLGLRSWSGQLPPQLHVILAQIIPYKKNEELRRI